MARQATPTAPSETITEAWSVDPFELAIYAPAPRSPAYTFHLPMPTRDAPERLLPILVKAYGDLDAHDPSLPDYDHTCDWVVTHAHVRSLVTLGSASVTILARLVDGKNVVIDGRHSVIACRIASQVREAIGEKPLKVKVIRQKMTDVQAASAMVTRNIRYDREPRAQAEQMQHLIDTCSYGIEDVAKTYGVSTATVRNRLKLLSAPVQSTAAKPKATKRPGRRMVEKLYDALRADSDTPKESLELIEYCLTGSMSKTVKKFLE